MVAIRTMEIEGAVRVATTSATLGEHLARAYVRLRSGEDAEPDLRAALALVARMSEGRAATDEDAPRAPPVTASREDGEGALRHDAGEGRPVGAIASLRVRALGPLHVEIDGRPLRFGRKLPRVPITLLKLLAAAERPLAREELISALWPGYGAGGPRGGLDTALYRLRRLVGVGSAVTSDAGCVALGEATCWTDVAAFRALCDRLRRAGTDPDLASAERLEALECELLDLYRGPFGDDDDVPPVLRVRRRTQQAFARAVGDLARQWDRCGRSERRDRLWLAARARDESAPWQSVMDR